MLLNPAQRNRILIVDDEGSNRVLYELALGNEPDTVASVQSEFETVSCHQGKDAVEAVRASLEKGAPFQVAFVDLVMPPGIDGIETAERIREIDPMINLVIVTGHAEFPIEDIAKRVPPVDKLLYQQKPIQPAEMLQLARALSTKWRLGKSSDLLLQAVEQSSVSIVITDPEGVIEYLNPMFSGVTGYAATEVIGETNRVIRSERNLKSVYEDLWNTIAEGETWRGELCNRRKSGELFWETIRISPIKSDTGKITHFLAVKEDVTARKHLEEELDFSVHHDAVTGLPNRLLALNTLHQTVRWARRSQSIIGVLLVAIDDFNKVARSLGPSASDLLIGQVADRLMAETNRMDAPFWSGSETIARLEGEQLMIILPGLNQPEEVEGACIRVLAALETAFSINQQEVFVTASVGATVYPDDGEHHEVLMRNAIGAAHRSAEAGGNRFTFFTPDLKTLATQGLETESILRRAIRDETVVIHYQPIVRSGDQALVAVEALARCDDGEGGLLPPDHFIPLAEHTGLIIPFGELIINRAMAQLREWHDEGNDALRMAINVSVRQFQSADLVTQFEQALSRYRLRAESVEIEITETLLLDATPTVEKAVNDLHDMGFTLSMDDFGTGYSSLTGLRRFPISTLKIDRSFVRGLPGNHDNVTLIDAIVNMARGMKLNLIGEGVETEEQRAFLAGRGCDYLQGYFFSKPVPAEHLRVPVASN
jgi:PAS domain S-box-containing protein/diguanylate cyclase (GGDEF)-like protein